MRPNKRQKGLIEQAQEIYFNATKRKIGCKIFIINEKELGFYINKSEEGAIFLMPILWKQDDNFIVDTILHEFAHYHLGHRAEHYKNGRIIEENEVKKLLKTWFKGIQKIRNKT